MQPFHYQTTPVTKADKERGIVGYTTGVYECVCGAPTNLSWTVFCCAQPVTACSRKCADNTSRGESS